MAIPTQIGFYERQPSGWWIDLRDGTGPYKTADGVTFTLAGSGGGGGGAFAISTEGGTSIHTENATTVIETEAA